ncbi:hypothetical protein [Nostoc sp. NMS4]|nr:hypothetical protein [Nostoc sp. NMS4]MBN3927360.1 hypothetical protein [Nostoc sp. NMS4]
MASFQIGFSPNKVAQVNPNLAITIVTVQEIFNEKLVFLPYQDKQVLNFG